MRSNNRTKTYRIMGSMRTDDGYIISKCLNGEPEAFGILVDKYKSSIFAFVYTKLRNSHDTQDVTQEVFIKAYRELHTLKRWDSFAGWIYRIAYNKCKDSLISKSRRPDVDFIEDQSQHTLDEPSIDSYRNDMTCQSLRDAMDSLPEIYREVLTLYYLGGMDSAEIAKVLSTSPTAIRHRLSRAREQLKEEVLAMMNENFVQQRLGSSFTFRVVEAIKRIKIHPISQPKGLPWGISLATGIVFTAFMFFGDTNPTQSNFFSNSIRSSLKSDMKVLKVGEIPIGIVNTSSMPMLSSQKGKDGKSNSQNAFFLAPQAGEGTWTRKGDMPFTNSWSPACEFNGKIYIFTDSGRNWEYDPMTDKYQEKSRSNCVSDHDAIVLNDKIYVTGYLGEMSEYDPLTDKWTKKASAQFAKRGSPLAVLNGKIYAIGGVTPDDAAIILSVVEVYDPVNDTWIRMKDLPFTRGWSSACTIDGKIYLFGGADNTTRASVATTLVYDPEKDEWTKKADMLKRAVFIHRNAPIIDEKIYIIGGYSSGEAVSDIQIYDPKKDDWAKGPDMPTARYSPAAAAYKDKIYIFGGSTTADFANANSVSVVEEYDVNSGNPTRVINADGKLPSSWGQKKIDR
jgi:RNA polymerase sigma factor (sigma-70 family)